MTSSWIKMSADLCTHPKVLRMADILAKNAGSTQMLLPNFAGNDAYSVVSRYVMRDVVIGCLLRVWSAANAHTVTGVFKNSSLENLDLIAGVNGFGNAMASVKWAICNAKTNTVRLPNFLACNDPAKGEKRRSAAAERIARWREKKRAEAEGVNGHGNVTGNGVGNVTVTGREEKSNTLLSPSPHGRVTPRPMLTERPAGWPVTEEQARSMAATVGVDADFAALRWLQCEDSGTWPAGQSFSVHLKTRNAWSKQDMSEKMLLEEHKAKLRQQQQSAATLKPSSAAKNRW